MNHVKDISLDAIGPNDPPEQPATGFAITCEKCGGKNIYINNGIQHGSEETGDWGSVYLVCRSCGHSASIHDAN